MNAEQAKKLREPFDEDLIGKLPKPTKKDNPKGKCDKCGGWHGLPAVHLDYVGHAAVTDRLLDVDRDWTWRFLASNADGSPVVVTAGFSDPYAKVGIWIVLTVCGVDTPGFGEGKGFKDAISDAIRNAAMRRGVALDLWSKEDLHGADVPEGERAAVESAGAHTPAAASSAPGASASPSEPASPFQAPTGRKASDAMKKALDVLVGDLRDERKAMTTEQLWVAVRGVAPESPRWSDLRDSLTQAEASELRDRLKRYQANVKATAAA